MTMADRSRYGSWPHRPDRNGRWKPNERAELDLVASSSATINLFRWKFTGFKRSVVDSMRNAGRGMIINPESTEAMTAGQERQFLHSGGNSCLRPNPRVGDQCHLG